MGRAPIAALFHAGHLLAVAGPGAAPLARYSAGVDISGLLAPAGMPSAVVERAHRAAVAALRAPQLQPRLQELGIFVKE